MFDKTKNLLFVLAAVPVATGCIIVGNDDSGTDETGDGDGDPTTGDGDGDPTTGDGDGDGDPTTGDGDGDGDPTTGDGDGDGDQTTGDGDGDPTTGDGDGDPTTGGDGDICSEYAANYDACLGTRYYEENVAYCNYQIAEATSYGGADCGAAVESMFACLSTLDCAVFGPAGCPDELAAVEAICPAPLIAKLKFDNG